MRKDIVRPIAICVFRHNGRILAAAFQDPATGRPFYRPLGGTVEFGERSVETVARELGEELDAEVAELRFLGALENIFTYQGQRGHEIVMVYDGAFTDPALYEREVFEAREDDGSPFRAVWVDLTAAARPDHPPVYPSGLLELLASSPVSQI